MADTIPVPKIKDVALKAGVSTATVSRALSKPDTVAEATRDAVLEAARATGYRVNLAARNLRSRRAGAVVVLVPNLGNPFFSQILGGIESAFARDGLSVLVVDTKQTDVQSQQFFQYLHHSRADGIISLDGSLPTDLLEENLGPSNNLPIIFACEWHMHKEFPGVRVNNREGVRLAVRHLVELGHTKIGFLQGPEDNVLSVARGEGFRGAMDDHDLDVRPDWQFEGDFSMASGAKMARHWLKLKDRPTAVFCANDESALGLISELSKNGVRVPDNLSVVGFDDIEVSQFFIPPLTTVQQPRTEVGQAAAELLMSEMKQRSEHDPRLEILPVKLVVRESTAAVVAAS